MKSLRFFILASLVVVLTWAHPVFAVTIQEVTSKSGVKAWLVEDHKLPLMTMHFAFRGGVEQDPPSKQGLANLTMNLLTEGAGPYDAAAFQQRLADRSIVLRFAAGRDALIGSLKNLSVDRDTAFELLQASLTAPHFDPKSVERLRDRQLTALRMQFGSPAWQARYALFQYIFGVHPYGERRLGTSRTLASITADDIKAFAAKHLARSNLIVAVAGDITPSQLAVALDKIFGDLPQKPVLATVPEVVLPPQSAVILVPREGTQTELLFTMPGPKRNDVSWFADEIANYILGGGGFSSRLMQDVRDDKGLTYGIGTSLSPMEHGGIIVGEAATDNAKTRQAWEIIQDTMRRFYQDGATEKEVQAAKDYLTGSLPLEMTSTDAIVAVLTEIQLDRLGRDYLDRYNDLIRSVTVDDVNRAIKRWLNPDGLTLSMVGKPDGMVPTQIKALVKD